MIIVKNYKNKGFSLVELVTVIILLGILSVFALGRFGDQNLFAARGFYDDTVSAIRFAQKLAVSTGCDVQVRTTGTSYQLFQSSTCTADDYSTAVVNPADRAGNYSNSNMPTGFMLTPNPGTITFNGRGVREEPTSIFTLSDGTTNYMFTVHTTGFVEG